MTTITFATLGVVTGVAAAALVLLELGAFPGVILFGQCMGMRMLGRCNGLDQSLYIFPGLTFGLGFAFLLWHQHRLAAPAAAGLAAAAAIANAVAVVICSAVIDQLTAMLGEGAYPDLPLALSGAIAGAAGGGLLGAVALRLLHGSGWPRLALAGALLGLAVPIVGEWSNFGVFLFYALWQAGYAAVLASGLARAKPDRSVAAGAVA